MSLWNNIENSQIHYAKDAQRKKVQLGYIKSRNIIIYGYGTIGIGVEKICCICNFKIAAICDKNKIGTATKFGVVEDFRQAVKRFDQVVVIVSARGFFQEIVNEYKDLVDLEYFVDGDDFYHDTASFFVLDKESEFFRRKIDVYRNIYTLRDSDLKKVMNALADEKSRDTIKNMFKYLMTYNKEYLTDIYDPNQYFPKDIITLSNNEVFVDCGAYDGDTIVEFMKLTENSFEHFYCFEPGPQAYDQLTEMIRERGMEKKVTAYPYGVFSSKGRVSFSESGTSSRITTDGVDVVTIETESIDNLKLEGVSFIKMDIMVLWFKIVVACVPAAVVGILFDDILDVNIN